VGVPLLPLLTRSGHGGTVEVGPLLAPPGSAAGRN